MQKKKKKLKIKKRFIVIFIIFLVVIFLYNPVKSVIQLKSKGYDFSSVMKIYKTGIKKEVLEKDYSKTLDNIITTDYYDKNKLADYFNINYLEYDNFNENVSSWLNLGYTYNDINMIYEINNEELNKKVSEKYIKDITEYLSYNYFKVDKLDRYLAYFNGDYSDTIIKVNIGLDKAFYEDPNIVKDYSVDMIVNKYNEIDSSFVPKDLVELTKCSDKGQFLTNDAKKAYDELCDASIKAGINLGVTSSYRSYDDQKKIYNSYLKSNGQDYVNKYVATPGYSEHQTGLALDVKSTVSSPFKSTKEYKWMLENSYKYGFILRYTLDNESITGYNAEAWHFRYVGIDIAKYIYDNGISFEEYYAIFK